jgi:hypothetical protein
MGIELAQAYVRVRGDAGQFSNDIRSAMPGMVGAVESSASKINGILAGIGVGVGVYQLVSMFKDAARAGEEETRSAQKLDVMMRTAGEGIGFSSKQLSGWIDAIMESSTATDDSLRGAATTLLRFGEVGGDQFRRVLQVATDMSVTFGDVESNAMLLARALSYPVNASRMLRLAGIQLSESQRDNIKKWVESGEKVKAVELLLGVFEAKYRTLAATMTDTPLGKLDQTRRQLEDIKEEMGQMWMPVTQKITELQVKFYEVVSFIGGKIAGEVIPSIGKWTSENEGLITTIFRMAEAYMSVVIALKTMAAASKAYAAAASMALNVSSLGVVALLKSFFTGAVTGASLAIVEQTERDLSRLESEFKATSEANKKKREESTGGGVAPTKPKPWWPELGGEEEKITEAEQALEKLRNQLTDLETGASDADKAIYDFGSQLGVTVEQADEFERITREIEKWEQMEAIGDAMEKALDEVNTLASGFDEFDRATESFSRLPGVTEPMIEAFSRTQDKLRALKEDLDFEEEGIRMMESLMTPMEEYQEELGKIQELLDRNKIDEETAERARARAAKKLSDASQGERGGIESGFVGFADLGRRIQESMLKGKQEEQQQQMIGIQDQQLKVQNELLAETRKKTTSTATLASG